VKRLSLLLVSVLAGCDVASEHPDERPISDLGLVAVLPFQNQTGVPFDADEFANILASELLKSGIPRVVRPAQLQEPGETARSVSDAIRLARRARADTVLACAITDYDPYDPPRVAISVQVLRVHAAPLSGQDLDRLLQSASWRRGALALSRDGAPHAAAAFETVLDAQDPDTRRALRVYAERRPSAFGGEREFLAVQSRYLQFVSGQIIQRLLAHGS